MRLRSSLLILLGACVAPLAAQMRFEQNEGRNPNSPISYEAVALFDSDSSKAQLNIQYRVNQSFFIFVRNETAPQKAEYVAHGELTAELMNDQKVSVAREIRQLPISRTTLPRETDRPPNLQGVITFSVPPGNYTLIFSVDDHESGRTFMEKTRKVSITEIKNGAFQISDLMMTGLSSMNKSSEMFVPMNRGGDVLMAASGGVLTEVALANRSDSVSVQWTLNGQESEFGQNIPKMVGTAFTSFDGLLRALPQEQGVLYNIKQTDASRRTLFIPLPLEKLQPGSYTLDVQYRSGKEKKQQTHQFHVIWPSHPFSLLDPELAIDALRHIAKEGEIEDMMSGSSAHRAEAFYRFWREKDRDTTTAYNEAMAEYYYRVDETMRKFSTSKDNDGYKTDRGRVYILYGPPPKSERLLKPDSPPTEIWTYDNLRRRFIFIDPSRNGNYILSQAENL